MKNDGEFDENYIGIPRIRHEEEIEGLPKSESEIINIAENMLK